MAHALWRTRPLQRLQHRPSSSVPASISTRCMGAWCCIHQVPSTGFPEWAFAMHTAGGQQLGDEAAWCSSWMLHAKGGRSSSSGSSSMPSKALCRDVDASRRTRARRQAQQMCMDGKRALDTPNIACHAPCAPHAPTPGQGEADCWLHTQGPARCQEVRFAMCLALGRIRGSRLVMV